MLPETCSPELHALAHTRSLCDGIPSSLYCADGKCKMRRSSFSVPTAAGESLASVPLRRAAVPTPSQRSMPAELLEMVKSLKKENKGYSAEVEQARRRNQFIIQELKKARGNI